MQLSYEQAKDIAERTDAIVVTGHSGRGINGATSVGFTVSNELCFALAAADVLGLAGARKLIRYARRTRKGLATVIHFPGVHLDMSGWRQASSAWRTPDPDFPGDQRLDLPQDHDTAFWGEVGPHSDGWDWTIVATNGIKTWDEERGTVSTEAEAKAAVENWRVPVRHKTYSANGL
ncbi:MAG: hypothetical protein ACXU95_14500 [Isosphaeraceae bacterium]